MLAALCVNLALSSPRLSAVLAASPLPAGFVFLREVEPTIIQDMRYAGDHNFMQRKLPGYEAPECVLTEQAAVALASAQRELAADGLGLKVFDCYRPRSAVKAMMDWAGGRDGSAGDSRYFPKLEKSQLVTLGYIARRSTHSTGAAVDLTLVELARSGEVAAAAPVGPCTGPAAERSSADEVDMGTGFDCFDPKSHSDGDMTAEQRRSRTLLADTMRKHGFAGYRREWWHFSFVDGAKESFDFPILAPP